MTQEGKILGGIGLITILILIAGVFFLSNSNPPTTATGKIDNSILVRNDSEKEGNPKAKIILVEFSDFQCPYCGASYQSIKDVVSKYKKDILFVYRHYPLPQHQNALLAAEVSEAAGMQGKFWEMHDMLFENQSAWSESTNALDIFKTYAKKLDLDETKFLSDVTTEKGLKKIQKDKSDGTTIGIQGTPAFFLNGEQFTDYTSPTDIKDKLDQKIQSLLK